MGFRLILSGSLCLSFLLSSLAYGDECTTIGGHKLIYQDHNMYVQNAGGGSAEIGHGDHYNGLVCSRTDRFGFFLHNAHGPLKLSKVDPVTLSVILELNFKSYAPSTSSDHVYPGVALSERQNLLFVTSVDRSECGVMHNSAGQCILRYNAKTGSIHDVIRMPGNELAVTIDTNIAGDKLLTQNVDLPVKYPRYENPRFSIHDVKSNTSILLNVDGKDVVSSNIDSKNIIRLGMSDGSVRLFDMKGTEL